MEAAGDTVKRAHERGRISHVAFDQHRAWRQVLAFAGGEIVQHADRIAARQQRLAQMRTDEARTAGHQPCRHAPSPALVTLPTPSSVKCSRATSSVVRSPPTGTPIPRQASSITTTS